MKKTITFPKSIYSIVFFLIIFSQSAFAQTFNLGTDDSKRTLALIIGISDYQYIDGLQYADKDAEDFANYLTSKDGLNLPKSDVRVFTNDKATKSNISIEGLYWLETELKEGDEAFIYFSGHGDIMNKETKNLIKTGYLLTYETRRPHFGLTALSMNEFLERFHSIASKKNAVIRLVLDVCHAGFGLEKGVMTLLDIDDKLDPNKQIIVTSCTDEQYSWEYPDLKNSCFSYFFLEGLKGAADENGNKIITLEEIEDYSTSNVKRYVRKKSNEKERQTPQFKGSHFHVIAQTSGNYKTKPIDYDKLETGTGKGTRKGVFDTSEQTEVKVEKILKKTKDKSWTGEEIQKKFKIYMELPEETSKEIKKKRKAKRELLAAVIEQADRSLSAYYEKESEIMSDPFNAPVSEYYLIAANLVGEEHFLYDDFLGKYFFMDALKLRAIGQSNDTEVINRLENSEKIEPEAPYTLNELGNVYFEKKEYEKALEYYEKAISFSPGWAKPLENKIATDKKIETKHTAQNLMTAKSPANPVPTPYEIIADSKLETSKSSLKNTKPVAKDTQDKDYHIQLAAAKELNRDAFKKVEDLGPINPKLNPNKPLINIWLGPFDSEKEAKMKLAKVKERGFENAFLIETARDTILQKKLDKKKAEMKKELAANMRFQVRVAAVKVFSKEEFSMLDKIGEVEAEELTVNGKTLFRVLIRSNYKNEADDILQEVKKAGYKDAYIFENKAQVSKSSSPGAIPSSYKHTSATSAKYKVRVATVSKLVDNQFSNLENLGKIYMDVDHDKGLIRVSVGYYPDKKKALEILNQVKKLGYKDAFIQS